MNEATVGRRSMRLFAVAAAVLMAGAGEGRAQEEEEARRGWADKAELSIVVTSGNSEISTFGFRNELAYFWENAHILLEAQGIRTKSGTITRTPVGPSPDDFVIVEETVTEITAENYLARTKFDRDVSMRVFFFGSGGWDRNEFAGIRNRFFGAGGVGNIWSDREAFRWRSDYGVSITREEGIDGDTETFVGLRLSSDFARKLSNSTTLTNVTIADANLQETDDLRVDTLSAIAVSINDHLALKISLQFLFDNEPSFVRRRLEFPRGSPLDVRVPVPADELDTRFSVTLVVDF